MSAAARRTAVRLVAVGVLTAIGLAPQTAALADQAAPHPVRASRGDPYAGCTGGAFQGSPPSVLYPGAEVEPSVTSNRVAPNVVVGAWQQDRWSDGGAHGIVAAYSRDAGRSFGRTSWPVSRCAPGGLDYERASDPWVSMGPDGVVYGSALSFDVNTPRNAVVAVTSYDGGRTWRNTTALITDTAAGVGDDKNSVTADPRRPGTAYQVWDRLVFSPDGSRFVGGPTWLSVTHDAGRSWSAPKTIAATAPYQQSIGNVIVVDARTGTLYNFYTSIQYTDATGAGVTFVRFEVVRSADGGRTWSQPSIVATDTSVPDVAPNTGAPLRTGAGLPFPAIDPRTGELYVAYEGSDFSRTYNQIQLVSSTDGGRSWSGPVRVNGDPSVPAYTPSIAVTRDGDVGVMYYDVRALHAGNTTTLPTSTWLTVSPRGGRHFGSGRQLAPVFDFLQAPNAGGYFVGDYQGLTTVDDRFRALFVTTNSNQPDNRTDVWYSEAGSPGWPRDATAGAASAGAASAGAASAGAASARLGPVPTRGWLRR